MIIRRDFARNEEALNWDKISIVLSYVVLGSFLALGMIHASFGMATIAGNAFGALYFAVMTHAIITSARDVFRHHQRLGREECP